MFFLLRNNKTPQYTAQIHSNYDEHILDSFPYICWYWLIKIETKDKLVQRCFVYSGGWRTQYLIHINTNLFYLVWFQNETC